LEFSALLRQAGNGPRQEKLKFFETIIHILDLHDLADTLIGYVGAGLSVEQCKRVTIGIELVYMPVRMLRYSQRSGCDVAISGKSNISGSTKVIG
jgi:hypothetical protein